MVTAEEHAIEGETEMIAGMTWCVQGGKTHERLTVYKCYIWPEWRGWTSVEARHWCRCGAPQRFHGSHVVGV
jgi:hypothetical protein